MIMPFSSCILCLKNLIILQVERYGMKGKFLDLGVKVLYSSIVAEQWEEFKSHEDSEEELSVSLSKKKKKGTLSQLEL